MKFTLRDAGEVEIRREGDQLVLIEARPNDGWVVDSDDPAEDEIEDEDDDAEVEDEDEGDQDGQTLEVTFVQGDHEVEFEAEIVDGRLLIEIEESWSGVEPGTFNVDDAGTVEIRRDGERLILAGVIANDGWDFEAEREVEEDEEEESSEQEIEVTFTSGDREVEFEATLEDGELDIEIETKWYVDEESS
jgi:virulence-associated protein VagC